MTWADSRELVERAQAGGYAVGAFNMHSDETAQALVQAAERADSPVFLQVGRAIVPHMGLRAAYELTRRAADESGAEMVIHLDHGPWDEVFEAIKLGFHSIMYDGAHLPFDENIRTTRHVVEVAHSFGIPVEAELGKIPDADEEVDWQSYYTDVGEAERFVAETGVDWLAISVGIVHGVPLKEPQPLDIQRIKDIKAVTGIPLVLHGASGVPDDEIRAATEAGVHKFNADTDLRHAFRAGIEETWAQGDRQLEDALAAGRTKMIDATVAKMELYGCAGRTGAAARAGAPTRVGGVTA
jgi:fructose-bisphosphate aldolase, class II